VWRIVRDTFPYDGEVFFTPIATNHIRDASAAGRGGGFKIPTLKSFKSPSSMLLSTASAVKGLPREGGMKIANLGRSLVGFGGTSNGKSPLPRDNAGDKVKQVEKALPEAGKKE